MVHIQTAVLVDPLRGVSSFEGRIVPIRQSVLIIRDDEKNSDFLNATCEFLDIGVEHANSGDDLERLLRGLRPLAVIADLDGEVQDGFHVMKVTARYDRRLPVMLLGCNDPALLGAVDAIQEIWGLTRVALITSTAGIGAVVDFICHAARDAGKPRLMRI
jgi:DNA-binding NtrC family response regulator